MFTGIVETIGTIEGIQTQGTNKVFKISSSFTKMLTIDQSIAHNGVCLTIDGFEDDCYRVVAIQETLQKTNLGQLKKGYKVNLERCLKLNDRIEGHLVSGHVDTTGAVEKIIDENGSWCLQISYKGNFPIVQKGSICVNGISLTVTDIQPSAFYVAIIPYTYQNTNCKHLQIADNVNLEFDIFGKYIAQLNSKS